VRRTVPPSAEIEERIDQLLAVGVGENPRESLSELAKLGARLIIQRAVEDEFDAWLGGRATSAGRRRHRGCETVPSPVRADRGGELSVEIPQVRAAAEPFVARSSGHERDSSIRVLPAPECAEADSEAGVVDIADMGFSSSGTHRVRSQGWWSPSSSPHPLATRT
jgi:hypothetical protein